MKKLLMITLIILLVLTNTACQSSESEINDNKVLDTVVESMVETKIIRVGVMDVYSPYIVNDANVISGPYIDIISKVLENLGYDYELIPLPWSRLLKAVETGEVDLAFPMYDNSERRSILYYAEEPIGFSQMRFAGLNDSKATFNGDFTILRDYRIGVVQDYFYSSEFEQAVSEGLVKTEEAISTAKNIEKLLQGRVDLILEDVAVVNEYIKANNIEQNLIILGHPVTSDYNHIVFTKTDKFTDLRRGIDQELKRMKRENSIYEIYLDHNMKYYGDIYKTLEATDPPPRKYFQDGSNMPLSIGVLGDTKPYTYYENDELTGFGIELISEVLTRIGVEYEFVDLPFSRMLEELDTGNLDIGTDLYLKPEREEYVEYPSLPYAAYPTVIFKKSSNQLEFTGNLEELEPYTIGYIRDYSLGPLDEYKDSEQFNFVITGSPEQNIENLVNDRVDLIIDIKSTGENIVDVLNLTDDIVAVEPPIYFDYSYIVFSKKSNLSALVAEYDVTILEMFKDGSIKRLSEKYNLPYLEFEELK